MTAPKLIITASPHIRSQDSTPRIMWHVVGSLVPVVFAAAWYFGLSALLVIAAATAGALIVEYRFGKSRSLWDGSAMITGLLLGLCLPAGMPLWMAFLGGAFGIGFGKLIFGGLGQNVFNPALVGRAFLQAAFPVAITTWPAAGQAFLAPRDDTWALPFMQARADVVTAATPITTPSTVNNNGVFDWSGGAISGGSTLTTSGTCMISSYAKGPLPRMPCDPACAPWSAV